MQPKKQVEARRERGARAGMLALRNMQLGASVADPAAIMPDIGAFYSSPAGISDPMQTMGMTYTTSNKAPASSYNAAQITK